MSPPCPSPLVLEQCFADGKPVAHIIECPQCRKTWDAYVEMRRELSTLEYEPPNDLAVRRVRAHILQSFDIQATTEAVSRERSSSHLVGNVAPASDRTAPDSAPRQAPGRRIVTYASIAAISAALAVAATLTIFAPLHAVQQPRSSVATQPPHPPQNAPASPLVVPRKAWRPDATVTPPSPSAVADKALPFRAIATTARAVTPPRALTRPSTFRPATTPTTSPGTPTEYTYATESLGYEPPSVRPAQLPLTTLPEPTVSASMTASEVASAPQRATANRSASNQAAAMAEPAFAPIIGPVRTASSLPTPAPEATAIAKQALPAGSSAAKAAAVRVTLTTVTERSNRTTAKRIERATEQAAKKANQKLERAERKHERALRRTKRER